MPRLAVAQAAAAVLLPISLAGAVTRCVGPNLRPVEGAGCGCTAGGASMLAPGLLFGLLGPCRRRRCAEGSPR